MKEINSIVNQYADWQGRGVRSAIATVINVLDSAYRRPSARMLISETGEWIGGISGGCLEGDVLKQAQKSIFSDKSHVVRYDTRTESSGQIGIGLGCNGLIEILIAPLGPHNPTIQTLQHITSSRTENYFKTIVSSKEKHAPIGHTLHVSASDPLVEKLDTSGKSTLLIESAGNVTFVEKITPVPHLVVCGHNYDVVPLLTLAHDIGWRTTVVSPLRKLTKSIYERSDHVAATLADVEIDPYTYTLLMAHDYKTDRQNLKIVASSITPYIGILGPAKRTRKMLGELMDEGMHIDRDILYGPVGIDTGATTPEEIAIAILAEIRAHVSGRSAGHLRDRDRPIHS